MADFPLADVYLDDPATGTPIFEDVAFGDFTAYYNFAGGSRDVRFTNANTSSPVVHTQALNVPKANYSTYYLGGNVATPPLAGAFAVMTTASSARALRCASSTARRRRVP
ncbi:MAG: DUF4397 domain-containing protein [Gammaproteobacteria bacterium]|nr:DUF4397 domain-containing protein [Gammaproteobacteria bacterium]